MNKSACLLAILVIFASCNSGNKKSENNQHQSTNLSIEEAIEKKDADIAYTQCPLAYLVEGELFFHSLDDNKNVKFVEEPVAILNFAFDSEGKTLFYSVKRDSSLWLKSADIYDSKVTLQWIVDWKLKEDNELENRYSNKLFYHKGELLIEHDFNISFYSFRKYNIYSIANHQKITREMDYEGGLNEKFKPEVSEDKSYEYFETTREQLYYTRNNVNICLTNKLDINALKTKDDIDVGFETEFNYYTFSPDSTKILFKVLLGFNEETFHGPYCVANVDGSKQMILEQAVEFWNIHPVWLKNNKVIFIDSEENLYVANNDDKSVQKLAENVSSYLGM